MQKTGLSLEAVHQLVKTDMTAVNELIGKRIYSEVALATEISQHLIHSGGKRLRPLLVLLSALAWGYSGQKHIELAAIIEFIHTATLLHDDVVDASHLRRGKRTANDVWGNEASVLVGDFLYSRAFQMMTNLGQIRVLEVLSETTNTIVEGEILQLMNCGNPDTSEERYMQVIRLKTAKLFEAAGRLGALIAGCTPEQEQAMATFGLYFGTAYQLIDDLLDYSASSEQSGKNLGDDLAEGKPTLPLIYALKHCHAEQAKHIRAAIDQGGLEQLDDILTAIHDTRALDYTRQLAQQQANLAQAAIAALPESSYKEALFSLAQFVVDRNY